jgi:hypothetical protein
MKWEVRGLEASYQNRIPFHQRPFTEIFSYNLMVMPSATVFFAPIFKLPSKVDRKCLCITMIMFALWSKLQMGSNGRCLKYFCRSINELNISGLTPTNLLLERCLYPHITHQYQIVCQALLSTLKEEYKLMQHFSVMRVSHNTDVFCRILCTYLYFQKVYLMEAGDMMYDFYTMIFEKVRIYSVVDK